MYHTMVYNLTGQYALPADADGDVNSDGKVDKDDAIYLMYHTMVHNLTGQYPLYPSI